ncbi:hypothetical protein PsorP6_011058 [Peronosclerospora sorghi]|uniref:Uncharacterized protein n=1 Tax=Peronosclerospora sorghi TaxID=230839 RepID=A0ACC0VW28_9STRA|nr:hypothetical protein PsorP6_011058 [Peronosclerospora sorghi]
MFDGSFKATRKVNLSGRKTPATGYSARLASLSSSKGHATISACSKQELLVQNRLARAARHALKEQTAASLKIQARYRQFQTANRIKAMVFHDLEQQLVHVVRTHEIPNQAVPTSTLQGLLRHFLFATTQRKWDPRHVMTDRIRKVQDYLVFLVLVSSASGSSIEAPTNLFQAPKTPTWIYQMTKLCERALRMLVEEELSTSVGTSSIATNPYFLLVDTLTNGSHFATMEENQALVTILYRLGMSTTYSIFDAVRACIAQQAHEAAARVETDRLSQLIARLAAHTLQQWHQKEQQPRIQPLLRQFGTILLFSPASISSPVTHNITRSAVGTEHVAFWTSVVHAFHEHSSLSSLSWSQRAILAGNLIDLTILCSFQATLVKLVPLLLSPLVTPSHVQWAFPVNSSPPDSKQLDEECDRKLDDDESSTLPRAWMQLDALDDEIERESRALGDAATRVRAQWHKLCFSNFAAKCLNLVLDFSDATLENVAHFCHILNTIFLSIGRSYVLTVVATFVTPSPPILALLSALTVDEDATVRSSLIQSMWQWLQPLKPSSLLEHNHHALELLLVLNVMYSHMLLSLDDETFYDREWPLPLADVEALVTFLKHWIHQMCWQLTTDETHAHSCTHEQELLVFASVVTSVKLFNQLYDRDCRRRFLPEEEWLWTSMPPLKDIVDLDVMHDDEKNDMASIDRLLRGPTLSPISRAALILDTIPQVFAFAERVQLFQKVLDDDKMRLHHMRDEFARVLHVCVKRDAIVDDSFAFFQEICHTMSPETLKARVKVTFINEQGLEEAGIDGGGVFKEFIDSLTKQAFSPENGFFLETCTHRLYPNPSARSFVATREELLDRYRFLGRVLAKAVYENILVEPPFAAFFLNKLLGKFNYIDDLQSLDPALYTSLMRLKQYTGKVEDLGLTFSVDEKTHETSELVARPLVPHGTALAVTNDNYIRYIHLLANYKLNVQSSLQSRAFLEGFRNLIPGSWIHMFAPEELQLLIGGSATTIDIDDWERETAYGGGYHPSQPVIRWFWELVRHDFTPADRAALLKFITSCSRQPLLGFGKLVPHLCIHQVRVDNDQRLPSSSTCMNLLKLPAYSTKRALHEKLLYAIRANAGFDLS